ncbi:MAG: TIGR03032 family protein [Pseudomonadota bacterium]
MTEKPAPEGGAASEQETRFEVNTSRQFESWLAELNINLAFTTYQVGKLFFFGVAKDGRLAIFNRNLERCMGLAYADNQLVVAGLYQIYSFVDAAANEPMDGPYDSLFVPQSGSITGDVDAHDVGIGSGGGILFVNTLFSCIATTSGTHSFRPVWKPPFIDRLAAEDRCHLNGFAIKNGKPAYATAVAETNLADGWRDHRGDGGVILDCKRDEVVAAGLSMPHSPRLNGKTLYVHNSGTGHFGRVDLKTGAFEPIAFLPGYLRGLDFIDRYAVVGLSKQRKNRTFSGLELDANLESHKSTARCGVYVIDLKSGDIVHWAQIEGVVDELFDVAVLPGRRNTAAIGFRSDEIRRVISIEPTDG